MLVGNYLFVMFHELGHAMIHELGLPVVGVEEDAVDEFAAVALISFGRSGELPQDQRDALHQVVIDAALGFAALWEQARTAVGGDLNKIPYWDEHGLDIKRFYNVICLITGSDPARFGPLARETGMPDERIQRCEEEYRTKDAAWERLLTPYLRPDGVPAAEGERVTVEYGQATTAFSQALERDLRARQLLESVAEVFETTFVLPRGLKLVATECGEPNAFYDPNQGSVTICHELVAMMRQLLGGEAIAQPQPQPQTQPWPQPQPAPPQGQPWPPQPPQLPQPLPPQLTQLDAYLVGSWSGSYQDPVSGSPIETQVAFMPNRQYTQISRDDWTGFTLRVWGSYVVLDGSTIRTQVIGYDPAQYCGPTGYCTPILIPMGETVPIAVIDQLHMQLGPARMLRTG